MNTEIITRMEAQERGLASYFTGVACKHGHVERRRTDNQDCMECVRERAWRMHERNKGARAAERQPIMAKRLAARELLAQAKAQGLQKYVSGLACRNGHVSERYVKSDRCVACMAFVKARTNKKLHDVIRERKRAYHLKNRDKNLARSRESYWSNAEKRRAEARARYRDNPDLRGHKAERERERLARHRAAFLALEAIKEEGISL